MADGQLDFSTPKRVPLVIEPENRGSSTAFDARLVNAYCEKSKDGSYHIFQRPGYTLASQPPAAAATGRGVYEWRGNIYSIFADKVYKDGVAQAGTVDTTNGVYKFSSSMGATPRLQLGNGVKAYNYDSGAGLVAIGDPDFPAAFVKGWAYLDGTTYVMVAGANIQGSDINDTTAWNALNTIIAQIEPDQGKALGKQLVYVVAMKQWTTEIFYDAGNTSGSPLGTVQGAKINFGCLSADGVQEIDDVLMFPAATRLGGPQVLKIDGVKAQVVSTKPVERLLERADFSSVYSWSIKLDGHKFYVITLVAANLTLAYDMVDNMWSQWTDASGNYLPIVSSTYDSSLRHILQHASNGNLYYAGNDYATDNGSTITVDIYTPNADFGTRRGKMASQLEMITDQQVGSEMLVRVNDFDYDATRWTNFRKISLANRRPTLPDMGTFTRRVHHFRHQSPRVRMPRVQAVELQMELCDL